MRREFPMTILFVVGVIMLFSNFLTVPLGGAASLKTVGQQLGNWAILISAFAVGLAAVNLMRVHGSNIIRKRPSWGHSAILVTSIVGWSIIGILSYYYPRSTFLTSLNQNLYQSIIASLSSAMFALIAFYLASAAFRAFRMRSFDASILLIAAIVVMLGRAPIGEVIWSKFPTLANWLMAVPNNVGQRAIMIGAAIGAFATSLKVLLGIDHGYLGSE